MLIAMIKFGRWIVKHWAISVAVVLTLAITVTTAVCWNLFGKERPNMVPIYLTVTGMGEGKDMTARELMVAEDDSLANIFSMEYPEIYEDFQQPLVDNNVLAYFQGVRANSSKKFYVTIDGTQNNNLSQAYTYSGCTVEIKYR